MAQRDRPTNLGEQIGPDAGWVTVQTIIFLAGAIAGPIGLYVFGRPNLPWHRGFDIAAGIIAIIVGLNIAGQAQRDLGDSMRVAPTPLETGSFVDRGWYGRVRHPLYLSALIIFAGWALAWSSVAALAVTGIAFAFFTLKARHEERLLMQRYAEYDGYRRRVRWRFIPGVW
ncbi:MAG TPA: isoprenylcysteine carboxylmethyltransferase family protein [Thermomicrobiales bacterium]|nr:isoprenylcysteine carboxylmethyltransferase family protein [Thermomicrobiales bacterium]